MLLSSYMPLQDSLRCMCKYEHLCAVFVQCVTSLCEVHRAKCGDTPGNTTMSWSLPHFCVKIPWQKQLREEGLIWLMVSEGHSPSWRDSTVAGRGGMVAEQLAG